MSAPLTLALILAVAIPAALVRAYRRDPEYAEGWARARHIALTPESRPAIERYLRRVRVLRTWGGVAGALVPSLVEYAVTGRVQVLGFGTDGDSAPLAFGAIFAGNLLGVLCAELSLPRHNDEALRTAGLKPRDLEHYLPRHALVAQRAAAVAGAAGTVAIGVVPYAASLSIPSLAALVAAAAGILALAAGMEAAERWIVRRPQPFTGPDVVAVDNAIRAQSIQAFASAGLALLLLYCCGVAIMLQASQASVLPAVMGLLAAVLLVLSLLASRGIGADSDTTPQPTPAKAPV
jgi:hypothetical protein